MKWLSLSFCLFWCVSLWAKEKSAWCYVQPGELRYVAIDKGKEAGTKDTWLVEVDWPPGRTWSDGFKPPPD